MTKLITALPRKMMIVGLLIVLSIPGAIAATSPQKGLIALPLLIAVLAAGIFLLRNPLLFFWGIVFTAPVTDHIALNLGAFNVRPYSLLALGALVWGLLNFLTKGKKNEVIQQAIGGWAFFAPLGLLVIIKFMSAIFVPTNDLWIPTKFPLKFSILAALTYLSCFVVYAFCINKERILGVLKFWLHLSNGVVILAFIQLILSNVAGFHYVHHRKVIWFGRPYSVFREPDVLGSFVAATAVIIIPMIIFKINIVKRKYLVFTLGMNVFLMLILFVRAAWLGFLVALALAFISFLYSRTSTKAMTYINKAFMICALTAVVVPLIFPSFAGMILGRFTSIAKPTSEGASAYRAMELTAMVTECLPNQKKDSIQHFLIGHGDFTWSYWAPKLCGDAYNQDAKTSKVVMTHPGYCMILTFLFDNGIIGASLIIAFFGFIFIRYLRLLQSNISESDKAILMLTLLPQCVVLVCFQFSYDPITPFMWIFVAIHIAWAYQCQNKLNQMRSENE